jgi:hypothetical protein
MKNMGSVAVNQNPRFVQAIVCIAGDMISPVDDEHFFIELSCHSFSYNRTGKTGARYQVIKHSDARSSHNSLNFSKWAPRIEVVASFVPDQPAKRGPPSSSRQMYQRIA